VERKCQFICCNTSLQKNPCDLIWALKVAVVILPFLKFQCGNIQQFFIHFHLEEHWCAPLNDAAVNILV
jgi:hypothetical protein